MMELQTLQEALKVEIQVHQKLVAQMKQDPQNAELKKQLHELQAKITALSEKQRKVVEQLRKDLLVKQEPETTKLQLQLQVQATDKHLLPLTTTQSLQALPTQSPTLQQKTLTVTPVLTTKTLPLVLKAAATPTLPVSVLPQRPAATTVTAMVTAISNASKPTDSQSTPINLQLAHKLTNQGSEPVRLVSKTAVVVQATTTTTSALPIKVPQFVAPPRLTPRPTFQPQVRPKPVTPNNVPIAPAPPPPMMAAPQLLQRPVMLTTKLSTTLPSSAGSIHQVRIVNGQPCTPTAAAAKSLPTGPLAGIVISTPATSTRLATPTSTQTLQISGLASDSKTVKTQGGPLEHKLMLNIPPSTPPQSPAQRPKREDNPQKVAFMVSLGLVTHDHLEEIQSRRQERKRRTTANPVYSGAVFEPERKKSAVTYLNTPLHQGTRKRGRPPKYSSVPELGGHAPTSPSSSHTGSPAPERPKAGSFPFPVHPHHTLPLPSPSSGDGDIHEDFCTVCRRSGQLLMCDTCSRVYHLDCLDPPLKTIPKGMWICPKCQDQILKKEEAIPWPGTLAIVHSYIAYKEAKEEEKQKLMKWSAELKLEREQLEQRVKQLSNSITKCMETKNTILARQKEMHVSLEKVKHLVRLIQAFSFTQETDAVDGTSEDARFKEKVTTPETTMEGPNSETAAEAKSEAVNEVSTETTAPSARKFVDVGVDENTNIVAVGTEPVVESSGESVIVEDSAAATAAEEPSKDPAEPEVSAKGETEAETIATAAADAEEPTAVTINGTSDTEGVDARKDERCIDHTNPNSEEKNATTNSTEDSGEKKQEEITNNDSTNNSKTSEPSQHSLPALHFSLVTKE